jgi:hypothetical protein
MKGSHDDSIMSIAIAMYAGDISFTQLKRNEEQNKAMLESWVLSERTYEAETSHYSYGGSLDQIGAMSIDGSASSVTAGSPTKNQYQQYSWLFGTNKKGL